MDITKVPLKELIEDKAASIEDYLWCELAIGRGITEYSGGELKDRLERNQLIIATINAELTRRNIEVP